MYLRRIRQNPVPWIEIGGPTSLAKIEPAAVWRGDAGYGLAGLLSLLHQLADARLTGRFGGLRGNRGGAVLARNNSQALAMQHLRCVPTAPKDVYGLDHPMPPIALRKAPPAAKMPAPAAMRAAPAVMPAKAICHGANRISCRLRS